MQEQIKQVAQRLLVLYGYPGLRLADVADELNITRANIHYHFGSKQALVDEVIEDYMRDLLQHYETIWTDISTSYAEKVRRTIDRNRWRFKQFHDGTLVGSKQWSLIDRMRNDVAVLTDRAREVLSHLQVVEAYVCSGVRMAQVSGEISRDVPADIIAKQLAVIICCASTITQFRGGFEPLEQIYLDHVAFVHDAYPGISRDEKAKNAATG